MSASAAATFNRKDQASVSTLRILSAEMVESAKSGHPGLPLGAAPLAYVLWTRFLKHDPEAPLWPDRDRFVLSAGHGSALIYAWLHLAGYGLSLDDLKAFRQPHSRTPGHPEHGLTVGVEATTGPLGQGFAMGVGMALAERSLAARYNRPGFALFDHWTYALVSDGDLMEGVAAEAASLAGAQQLHKLVYVYDDNRITIEGGTELTFTEDVRARFTSYGWQVITVADGEDLVAVHQAVENARAELERPSLIVARTRLGAGSPKEGRPEAHGEPLGPEGLEATKAHYGFEGKPPFFVDDRVAANFLERGAQHREDRKRWETLLAEYASKYPDEHAELERRLAGTLPEGLAAKARLEFPADKPVATRAAGGAVINAVAKELPDLLGGSADLGPSNKTQVSGGGSMLPLNPAGRNIHFGVRESAMGAIANGLALSGGFVPYCGTFLVFSDYLRPALRLSALMGLKVVYVLTHDSVGVGEDGPTHQPVEHLAALRAVPGLLVMRPADAYETQAMWNAALAHPGPSVLALSRQNLPVLHPSVYPAVADGPARGGYVLRDAEGAKPEALVIATGSEVPLALKALEGAPFASKVRVVSLPCWELFESQTPEYRASVIPPGLTRRLAVEAGSPLGWERYAGDRGRILAVRGFGFSGPAESVFRELGFTPENVRSLIEGILA
ncbi:MAG: transketolase [Deltaproteobacteria bacterium]|jgi:transketolase|nr:transketolase [Deltaproteobacteria bacterium]